MPAPSENIQSLRECFEKAVSNACPADGIAYLLYRIHDDFYVPIAANRLDMFEKIKYALFIYQLPAALFPGVQNSVVVTLAEEVRELLQRGRIECVEFAGLEGSIFQELLPLVEDNSLVLVRSHTRQFEPMDACTVALIRPIMHYVAGRWDQMAHSATEEQLSATDEQLPAQEKRLEILADKLGDILADFHPHPPFFRIINFSMMIEHPILKNGNLILTRCNPLGLAQSIIEQYQVSSENWSWIAEMQDNNRDTNWPQDIKKFTEDVGKLPPLFAKIVDATVDHIVVVAETPSSVGSLGWRFYARHNRPKDSAITTAVPDLLSSSPRLAIQQTLKHVAWNDDYVVTLWAMPKRVGVPKPEAAGIPIGCLLHHKKSSIANIRSGESPESYIIEGVGNFRLVIEYETVGTQPHLLQQIKAKLALLEPVIKEQVQKFKPEVRILSAFGACIDCSAASWPRSFPGVESGSKARHKVSEWKKHASSKEFQELGEKLTRCLVNNKLLGEFNLAADHPLGSYDQALAYHYLHIAKGFYDNAVSAELLVSAAGGRAFGKIRQCYTLSPPKLLTGEERRKRLRDQSGNALAAMIFLKKTLMDLTDYEITTSESVKVTYLQLDFRSASKEAKDQYTPACAAEALTAPPAEQDGHELRKACALLQSIPGCSVLLGPCWNGDKQELAMHVKIPLKCREEI